MDEDKREIRVARKLFAKKYCPRCLSQLKVYGSLSGLLIPEQYICESCGYIGYIALEKEEQ